MNKRIKWLDFGKGFTIFSVVMYHSMLYSSIKSFPIFTDIISIFIMPVFFSISGYLYGNIFSNKDFLILLYKKISSFVLPFLVFSYILLILYKYRLASLVVGIPKYYPSYTNIYGVCYFGSKYTYLWFLYVLLFIFILSGLVSLVFRSKYYIKIISLIFIGLILLNISKFYSIKQFISWVVCFYIGYYLKYYNIINYIKFKFSFNRAKYFILLMLASSWIMLIGIQVFISGIELGGSNDGFSKIDTLPKLFSIILFLCIFSFLKSSRVFRYFCYYGKYTLVIYMIHLPIIFIVLHFFTKIILNPYLLSISTFIFTWLLCIIICKLLYKFNYIDMIFYPRKYINKILKRKDIKI